MTPTTARGGREIGRGIFFWKDPKVRFSQKNKERNQVIVIVKHAFSIWTKRIVFNQELRKQF